uniref:Uncharacterized protein n=1 Tax=Oryza glumipatula TaxID=40148 RepID=A0A0D9ZG22_9ORYZ
MAAASLLPSVAVVASGGSGGIGDGRGWIRRRWQRPRTDPTTENEELLRTSNGNNRIWAQEVSDWRGHAWRIAAANVLKADVETFRGLGLNLKQIEHWTTLPTEVSRRLPVTMQVERSAAPVDSAAAQPMEEVGRQLPATMQVERPAAPIDSAAA